MYTKNTHPFLRPPKPTCTLSHKPGPLRADYQKIQQIDFATHPRRQSCHRRRPTGVVRLAYAWHVDRERLARSGK